MDSILDIARWQFGIITVYHFLFVPLTIGLTALVAVMETQWLRTKDPEWLRLTKFFAKLMLINFAIGVVTGIVQEFQFGMNWSDYSRFVGDVFGAPLAVEALLAFFLESTFLGLWIFGWDKLPRGLHCACMWIVHLGTLASSWFILAANSWMQHPVGYLYNPDTGRAELTDFWAVMFNKVQLATFPHVILAAYMTGAAFVLGVSAWLYVSKRHQADRSTYRMGIRLGAWVVLIAGLGVTISGDYQGKIMTDVQPMKMAAAEALYDTEDSCAPFSIFTVGTPDGKSEKFAITVPCLLSFLATGHFDGKVEGINDLRAQYQEKYGQDPGARYYDPSGNYSPIIPVTYWTFRYMIGFGMAAALPLRADPLHDPQGASADHEVVRPDGHRRTDPDAAGQLGRLDLHRDGPTAVGGLRSDDDLQRRLARRQHHRGLDLADLADGPVRRARGRRGRPDRALLQTRPGPVRGATGPDARRQ